MIHGLSEEAYSFIMYCVTVVTLVVQLYVFFLVQFKSPEAMTEYRYFLNIITIWDMVFTIVFGTISLNPVQNEFASSTTGWVKHLNPTVQLILFGCCFYAGATVIAAQIYCLMYRFTVIQINKRLHRIFVSASSKIFWFLVQQSVSIFLGVFSYFACVQPEEFIVRAQQEESLEIRTFFIWLDVEKSSTARWFLGALVSCLIMSEALCTFLVYFTMKTLKRNSKSFTKTTRKLHRQFTILLAIQVTSPTLFILAPVTGFVIAAVIFKAYPYQWATQFGFIFMSFYPLSNALFTVFYISPYRGHFFQLLARLNLRKMLARRLGISGGITQVIPQRQSIDISTMYLRSANITSNRVNVFFSRTSATL